jgi:2-aminoadipate transaminase
MKKYNIDKYIEKNRKLYGEKCSAMLSAMEESFPKGKVEWTVPEGGIFLWCTCPGLEGDISKVVDACLARKVAIVPGSNFAIDQSLPSNQFRLNYSSVSIEKIKEGVSRLGEVLTEIL